MSVPPSAVDTLLAEKLAERTLAQQGGALRGMLKYELEAVARLKGLDFELETPLLGGAGLEGLVDGGILGVLAKNVEQQTAQRQASHVAFPEKNQEQRTLERIPNPPVVGGRSRRRIAEAGAAEETQRAQANRSPAGSSAMGRGRQQQTDTFGDRRRHGRLPSAADAAKQQRIQPRLKGTAAEPRPAPRSLQPQPHRSPTSSSSMGRDRQQQTDQFGDRRLHGKLPSDAGAAKQQRIQPWLTGNEAEPRPAPDAPSEIDAGQARERMAQRAAKAGVTAAWYSAMDSSSRQRHAQPGWGSDREATTESAIDPDVASPRPGHDRLQNGAKLEVNEEAAKDTLQPDRSLTTSRPMGRDRQRQADRFVDQKANRKLPSDADEARKQPMAPQLKGKKAEPWAAPDSPLGIDARQARERMAQRAAKAGVSAAWHAPMLSFSRQRHAQERWGNDPGEATESATDPDVTSDVPAPDYPQHGAMLEVQALDSGVVAASTAGRTLEGVTVVERQIERYLEKLIPRGAPGVNAAPNKGSGKRQTVAAPNRHRMRNSGPREEDSGWEGPPRQSLPQPEPGLAQERAVQAPDLPGGLRGLAAQAAGPLPEAARTIGTGGLPPQQIDLLPPRENREANTATGGSSSTSAAEIAELLAEEARRAGIDLEQFRP